MSDADVFLQQQIQPDKADDSEIDRLSRRPRLSRDPEDAMSGPARAVAM